MLLVTVFLFLTSSRILCRKSCLAAIPSLLSKAWNKKKLVLQKLNMIPDDQLHESDPRPSTGSSDRSLAEDTETGQSVI